ncbi:MAG: MMPL family transporter [Fibrobacter sp.]|jgi:predicted RND superfamily exporter protein|nr:MMPL family transporter [Fibrobacter sp.]
MFTFISRILRVSHRYPRIILGISFLICIACIFPVRALRFELGLLDTLPDHFPSKTANLAVEEKFGGFGTLTLVMQSGDSALNARLIETLADSLKNDPLVNFTEYKTEAEFYREHQLLYIPYTDLETIQERVQERVDFYKAKQNPMIVNLAKDTVPANIQFKDIEDKYTDLLRPFYGNADGTIQVLDIFPNGGITDLQQSRRLYNRVSGLIRKIPESKSVEYHYAGKVFQMVETGKTLLPEAKRAGIISAVFIFLILVIAFFKQPQIILFSAIPIAMSIFWTMGAAQIIYGRINLFTLLLALVLPGLACQLTTHIMRRYDEERRKELSPKISLESAMLGIGPSITASAFICAATFLCLRLVPLQGVQELGVLGAFGALLNLLLCCTVLPSLLILFEKKKPVFIFKKPVPKEPREQEMHPRFRVILLITILGTLFVSVRGVYPKFEYRFLESVGEVKVDSLLRLTNHQSYDPAVALLPDAESSIHFYEKLNQVKNRNGKNSTLGHILTFATLLPEDQEKKLELLDEIENSIPPGFKESLTGEDSVQFEILQKYRKFSPINENNLPTNIRRKFQGKDGSLGEFVFIFPAFDPSDGLACRRFAREIRSAVDGESDKIQLTGTAIIQADVLNLTLPHLRRPILFGIALIFVLLLVHYNRFSTTLATLASPVVAFFWLLALLQLLGIKISAYSALAFPLLIGMSLDGSLQLWNAYREKVTGSIPYIMKTTGVTVFYAQAATLIGFYSLLISSHPGLSSIGMIAMLGFICITLSHFLIFPLVAAYIDERRFSHRKKKSQKKPL